jgi:hypothetical protein
LGALPSFSLRLTRGSGAEFVILLFIINAIGLGPWFVGALSDALALRHPDDAIRRASLGIATVASAWAAVRYALGARTLREDVAAKDA